MSDRTTLFQLPTRRGVVLQDRAKRHLVHCLRVAATQFDESAKVFLSSEMKRLVYQDAAEARELADRIEDATFVNIGAQRKG